MVATLISLCGTQVLPSVKWTPHIRSPAPPSTYLIELVLMDSTQYPSPPRRIVFSLPSTLTARELYGKVIDNLSSKIVELRWKDTTIYPGNQTLHEMAFRGRQVVYAMSGAACLFHPHSHSPFLPSSLLSPPFLLFLLVPYSANR